jgi:hypothetical protein
MAKKRKKENPFAGRWRIVSMEQWDQDFSDLKPQKGDTDGRQLPV